MNVVVTKIYYTDGTCRLVYGLLLLHPYTSFLQKSRFGQSHDNVTIHKKR